MFTYFNNKSIRNLVMSFGSLFNNIYIKRYNSDGSVKDSMRVPLAYGSKEKYLRRADEGGSITNEDGQVVQMTLPRMSFEMSSLEYDPSRKRNTMQKLANIKDGTPYQMTYSYAEVPYNVDFSLHVMTKHVDDGLQIIEQILPYFTPEFTVTINATSLHKKIDIPIILTNVDSEEDWEGDFDSRRSITWTLNFVAKSLVFGRLRDSDQIKKTITKIWDKARIDEGLTSGAMTRIDVGVTGPSGASSDASNYEPDTTIRIFTWDGVSGGASGGYIDTYGNLQDGS